MFLRFNFYFFYSSLKYKMERSMIFDYIFPNKVVPMSFLINIFSYLKKIIIFH